MFQLRSLTAEDIGPITKIEQVSRPTPWTEKLFTAELNSLTSKPLVLTELGTDAHEPQIVGYVMPWHIADEIHIQNIVVAPGHRKLGLGELLLNRALAKGFAQGCILALLEVRESNTAAVGLYQKYSFQIVGRRENYYRDRENALLMNLGPFETNRARADYDAFIQQRADHLKQRLNFEPID